jgi:hypothetical protein
LKIAFSSQWNLCCERKYVRDVCTVSLGFHCNAAYAPSRLRLYASVRQETPPRGTQTV